MESRLRIIAVILVAALTVIALRLFQLQIVEGASYSRLAEQNRIRRFITPAPRGRFLDRNGQVLADNRPSFSILLVPAEADSNGVRLLADILGMTSNEIWDRLRRAESGQTPTRLRRAADLELVARVEENATSIPGVIVKSEPQRNYPYGAAFAHVLGYVGEVSETDLARDTSYRPGAQVGVAGLEARYESLVRGRDGRRSVIVNAWGREVGGFSGAPEEPPLPGNDVTLTLDAGLQQCAVRLLEPYERGAIVGLSLRDGGVLCLVSKPAYDPNLLSGSIRAEQWELLRNDKSTPFVNRVTMSNYNPGSLLKPLVAIAGQYHRVVGEEKKFESCNGIFEYGRGRFRCLARHGRLDLISAIVHSCNVYFYQLALRLGIDRLTEGMKEFGLGSPTGIDLPAEKAGVVPDRDWLDKRYGARKWSSGIVLNLGIGQGEVVMTPLQVAVLYAALARKGEYYAPHLLSHYRRSDGSLVQYQPERRRVSFPASLFPPVERALIGVVERGTGTAAFLPGIVIAGKTGTAQQTRGEDHAWFACYAGRPEPEVVFVVLIENGGKGGMVAAPLARELIRYYYQQGDGSEAVSERTKTNYRSALGSTGNRQPTRGSADLKSKPADEQD